ncbi:hypothetical protein [Pontibaca methylaminivorans]|uniref:hypothetical protein n=1 Tax=Pontibaca methylaminivorans TaxID=515897 RepID=UPI00117F052F|nr:hypothetical protein [Pontibaca methylaminivorans]
MTPILFFFADPALAAGAGAAVVALPGQAGKNFPVRFVLFIVRAPDAVLKSPVLQGLGADFGALGDSEPPKE